MTLSVQDFRSAFPEFGDAATYPDSQVAGWIGQIAGLRSAFPEFASVTTYPDLQVAYWIAMGSLQVGGLQFGSSLTLAIRLYAAHNLVLGSRANAGGSIGGVGVMSSKSVGGVSASYDTTLTSSENAGFYNATSYGQRFWQLLRGLAMGPVYVPQLASPGRSRLFPYRSF